MSAGNLRLKLYNTLTRKKEVFEPLNPDNVRMYVCGPTVYDYAHIGNARPVIVFDVLFRLLRHVYGETHVTYVRNITDVDDKIIARAKESGVDIRHLTETTNDRFQADVKALGNLDPTVQPRATETIPEMIAMIEVLIGKGHAYEAEGHVLFDVKSFEVNGEREYGKLAHRSLDDMLAGARVEVAPYKRDPMDFVLWKPSSDQDPGWDSPWGRGRPGWHIECSAMSEKYLGDTFDIHGGGIDLSFPHHENELAQSRCAHDTKIMAQIWMHNGFLQVEGQKMSKSLGNFVTIHELLETDKFGGRPWQRSVVRYAMLMTHYREPIDWTTKALSQARRELFLFADSLRDLESDEELSGVEIDEEFTRRLANDLDTPSALARLAQLRTYASKDAHVARQLAATLNWLGLMKLNEREFFDEGYLFDLNVPRPSNINLIIEKARVAEANTSPQITQTVNKYLDESDLRLVKIKPGLFSVSGRQSDRDWDAFQREVQQKIAERLTALAEKNYEKADAIRADLLNKGVKLMDYKDEKTSERKTRWELAR